MKGIRRYLRHLGHETFNHYINCNDKKFIVNRTRGLHWVNPCDELYNTSAPKARLRENCMWLLCERIKHKRKRFMIERLASFGCILNRGEKNWQKRICEQQKVFLLRRCLIMVSELDGPQIIFVIWFTSVWNRVSIAIRTDYKK